MSNEATIMREAMLALSSAGAVVFRNNVGQAVFQNGHRVRYGLHPGSSDLIGWRTITIGPQHLGQRVAVFLAVEVKQPGGRVQPEQINFIQNVKQAGGLAAVVYSSAEAVALLNTK